MRQGQKKNRNPYSSHIVLKHLFVPRFVALLPHVSEYTFTGASVFTTSARLTAGGAAAREVVHKHVHLAAVLDDLGRVAPEPLRDGVGHNAKALPELVHKAEGELAMPHSGTNKEEPWRLGALI